jgi:hypothetical protein
MKAYKGDLKDYNKFVRSEIEDDTFEVKEETESPTKSVDFVQVKEYKTYQEIKESEELREDEKKRQRERKFNITVQHLGNRRSPFSSTELYSCLEFFGPYMT